MTESDDPLTRPWELEDRLRAAIYEKTPIHDQLYLERRGGTFRSFAGRS